MIKRRTGHAAGRGLEWTAMFLALFGFLPFAFLTALLLAAPGFIPAGAPAWFGRLRLLLTILVTGTMLTAFAATF